MDALTLKSGWSQLSNPFSDKKNRDKTSEKQRSHHKQERLSMTPELEARIEEAEKNCREGNCVSCRNRDELHAFLDSL